MLKLVIISAFVLPYAHATSLKEAFEAAKLNMETLKRADSAIVQREEQKKQVRAAVLPTVAAVGNYTRIDAPEMAGVSRAFVLTRQYSAGLRLTQPLIRGGVIGAYQIAKENILLAEFQKDASMINLYQLVVNAYFALKSAQIDVKNLEELLKASRDRVTEIRERTKIGRSRRGELVEVEAQFHAAEAQYEQGQLDLKQAEKSYEFFTTLTPGLLPDLPELPKLTESLGEYLSKLPSRPDLVANRQQVQIADKQITVARAGHYPSVDLVGNYYFDRTGILETSEWDAAVVVNFPLYQGGGVEAEVRESVATKRVAELNSSEAHRSAERDLAILYQNYMQMDKQLSSLKTALAKSEEAWRLNRKDYQFGLVPNLDVIQSLNSYIQIKRSYNSLFVLAHQAKHSLDAAVGVLP